jgi:hypothetical protein
MHTTDTPGINVDRVKTLNDKWTWTPPLIAETDDHDLEGPESISVEELDAMFDDQPDPVADGDGLDAQVNIDQVYDVFELENIRKGVVPRGEEEEAGIHSNMDPNAEKWDPKSLMLSLGL